MADTGEDECPCRDFHTQHPTVLLEDIDHGTDRGDEFTRVSRTHPVCIYIDAERLERNCSALAARDLDAKQDAFLVHNADFDTAFARLKGILAKCTCDRPVTAVKIDGEKINIARDAATQLLAGRVRVCIATAERGLMHMRRGDLDAPSVTEAGFKAVLMTAIAIIEPDLVMHSEYPVEGRYVDLIVIDPKELVAVVLELKYVRMCYMTNADWNPRDTFHRRFSKYDTLASRLGPMQWQEVAALKYRDPKTKQHVPIITVAQSASRQVSEYAILLRDGALPLIHEGQRISNLGYTTVIGVATRCFMSPSI